MSLTCLFCEIYSVGEGLAGVLLLMDLVFCCVEVLLVFLPGVFVDFALLLEAVFDTSPSLLAAEAA